jgi:4-hydroxy-2-oxoglutarate aldolase
MGINGILAPVVTPFDSYGEIDLEACSRNTHAHLAAGASGIVVAGSTGEAALLDDNERLALIERARRDVGRDHTLLIGIGAESTRATIARAHAAAERGADGVLVVAPHYYGEGMMTPDALFDHYTRVADASTIPILLYTIPKYMHFAIPPEVVARLARHENIIGMKDSAGDATLFARYLESRSDTFRVLTGSGTLYGDALGMGADGAILAVSLFAPSLSFAVLAAHDRHDDEGRARAQKILTPLNAMIVASMGVAGVKAALDWVGLIGGTPRLPLRPIDATARERLDELMRSAELVPVA